MFGRLFDQDAPHIRFLSNLFDLAMLNFLWAVFSLPIWLTCRILYPAFKPYLGETPAEKDGEQ